MKREQARGSSVVHPVRELDEKETERVHEREQQRAVRNYRNNPTARNQAALHEAKQHLLVDRQHPVRQHALRQHTVRQQGAPGQVSSRMSVNETLEAVSRLRQLMRRQREAIEGGRSPTGEYTMGVSPKVEGRVESLDPNPNPNPNPKVEGRVESLDPNPNPNPNPKVEGRVESLDLSVYRDGTLSPALQEEVTVTNLKPKPKTKPNPNPKPNPKPNPSP